ncbi:hypothetical protein KBD81_02580 [Candidatus Woesebacteria bacterium]|nr:hypothetical protein [Candidatus Woesebacteria bacterium]
MMPNYTPFEVATFQKRYSTHKTGSMLLTVISILTVVVLTLIAYLLFKQFMA